jgi:uncharacterized protein YjiS (DUF1127 family)
MLDQDETDFASVDYRSVSGEQRARLKQQIISRANAARRQAMQDAVVGLGRLLVRIAARGIAMIAGWWAASRRRRAIATAIDELQALDDYMLKDMGISRGEIGAVVRAGEDEAPRVTAKPAHDKTTACALPFSAPGRPGFISAICSSAGGRTPMSR